LLFAAQAAAGDPAATVLALESERVRAMTAGDLAALERVFADDAIYTHSTGVTETKAEFLGQIRSGARKYDALTLHDLRARPVGSAIVVTGQMHGSVEADGKTIPLALVYTAVYAERGGRWQLAAYESTRMPETSTKGDAVSHHATGSFDVKTTPREFDEEAAPDSLGRYSLEKHYHGPLDASAKGQMLTVGTKVEGSAVYVAVEVVDGTLDGRKGTFALHHTGTMTRGAPALSITIVPDSGTGELAGISGSMTIRIEKGGAHFYDLEYVLH
jgi:ketosteroid isomerase-like protein